METISLKLEKMMLHTLDMNLQKHNFSTRTEFIRDAIREKLESLKKEELIQKFLQSKGKAKRKTSDIEYQRIRTLAWDKLMRDKGFV